MFPIKVAKRIYNAFTAILVTLCVAVAIMLVGVKLIGFDVYTVLSGSMEPAIHTGSVIYVKEVDPATIKVNDVITFVIEGDIVGTHRVTKVEKNTDPELKGMGEYMFYTKGDANEDADGKPVYSVNLLGTPVFTVPYMGYVADFVQNPPGTYIVIAGGCILLILIFMSDIIFGPDEKKEKKKNQKAAEGDLEQELQELRDKAAQAEQAQEANEPPAPAQEPSAEE